jgi:hypothetical protein
VGKEAELEMRGQHIRGGRHIRRRREVRGSIGNMGATRIMKRKRG